MSERLASEVLREARAALFERGWHQGDFVAPTGAVCAYGAISVATIGSVVSTEDCDGDMELHEGACEALTRALDVQPGLGISRWNDTSDRTFDEVIEAFDKAEKLALIGEEQS